jgi:hypothetical protein
MPNAPADAAESTRLEHLGHIAGVALVGIPTLLRTCVAFEPFPVWNADPFSLFLPETALGPAAALALDLITLLGAMLLLLVARTGRPLLAACLLSTGALAVALHTAASPDPTHVAEIASPWLAALAAAVGLAHLPATSPARLALWSAALGLVALFAARGLVQVFIEHPATVADYATTRDAFLAARGWSERSPMALLYERRLHQPEATGWFGLANVFASFAAAHTLAWLAIAIAACRARLARPSVIAILAAAAAATSLTLAGSKGAAGALLLAAIALVIVLRAGHRARIAVALVPILAIAAVIARGLVGETLDERSSSAGTTSKAPPPSSRPTPSPASARASFKTPTCSPGHP